MDLNMMRQFIALAEEKNMRKASERIFVSQSALSQTLKRLEIEMDVPLFQREKNGLMLTEYGTILYNYSVKIVAMAEECVVMISEKKRARQVIRIATDNDYIMSFIIPHFISTHEDIKISGVYMTTEELPDSFERADYDIIISEKNYAGELRVESDLVTRYKLYVAVPRDHPVAKKQFVYLRELEGEEFARGNRKIKETIRLNNYLEKNKIGLKVIYTTGRDALRIFEKRSNYLMFECSYKLLSAEPISPHRALVEVADEEITGYPLYIAYRTASAKNTSLQIFTEWIWNFVNKDPLANLFHEDFGDE